MMSNSFIYLAVNKISKKKYVGQTAAKREATNVK